MSFEVGQWVRVSDRGFPYPGRVGQVTEISEQLADMFWVRGRPSERSSIYYAFELEPLTETEVLCHLLAEE